MSWLDTVLNCASCDQILVKPVLIPCGHSICASHSEEERVHCKRCSIYHTRPENGFTRNLFAETLIERQLNELDLGEDHSRAVESFKQLEDLVSEARRIRQDPELEIHRVISELKNRIDLRREELKQQIDNDALELIDELIEFENECKTKKSFAQHSYKLELLMKSFESDLIRLKSDLVSFKKNVQKWKEITARSDMILKSLKGDFIEFKNSLFCNKLEDYKLKQQRFCDEQVIGEILTTFEYQVKNLGLKNEEDSSPNIKSFRSQSFSQFGIDWQIDINIKIDKNEKVVGVFLVPEKNSDKYYLLVDGELAIVNRENRDKNIVRNNKNQGLTCWFENNNPKGFYDMIDLSKLMSSSDFYNPKDQSITVEATIYNIQWVKI